MNRVIWGASLSLTFAERKTLVHEEEEPGVASRRHHHEADNGELHVAEEKVWEAWGQESHEYSSAGHVHTHPASLVLGE